MLLQFDIIMTVTLLYALIYEQQIGGEGLARSGHGLFGGHCKIVKYTSELHCSLLHLPLEE